MSFHTRIWKMIIRLLSYNVTMSQGRPYKRHVFGIVQRVSIMVPYPHTPARLWKHMLSSGLSISQAELVRIRLDRRVCGCVVVWVMPIVRQWRWRVEDHMLRVNCFLLGVSTAQTELVRTCWKWRVCGGAPSHLFFLARVQRKSYFCGPKITPAKTI